MTNTEPKHSDIEVQLTGNDGNAAAMIAAVRVALRRARVSHEEVMEFSREATSGDYDNVLQTCMRWVTVY